MCYLEHAHWFYYKDKKISAVYFSIDMAKATNLDKTNNDITTRLKDFERLINQKKNELPVHDFALYSAGIRDTLDAYGSVYKSLEPHIDELRKAMESYK